MQGPGESTNGFSVTDLSALKEAVFPAGATQPLRTGAMRIASDVAFALTSVLEYCDESVGDHAKRTALLAMKMAFRLGLGSEGVWTACCAAVMHDIGKVGIPEEILNKPGKLDEHEWEIIKRHPQIGADILSGIAGLEKVRAAVLAHHERYDGRGYPAGLSGEDIPVEARLISVIDAYDAMTNERPYRRALSHRDAVERLEGGAGSQFDPLMVATIKDVLYEDQRNRATAYDRRVA